MRSPVQPVAWRRSCPKPLTSCNTSSYPIAPPPASPGEIRPASSEFGAIRIANSMAAKFAGVAAYEVMVDKETGDMGSPRILAQIGTVPALDD